MTGSRPPSFVPLIADAVGDDPAWTIESPSDLLPTWITLEHRDSVVPQRGWKLHISATTEVADEVLRRALGVLLADDAPFKVAASVIELDAINEGDKGISQIGKFITVYPADDAHAVRLAQRLAEATDGFPGPPVPSDKRVSIDGVVHYRYGDFVESPNELLASLVGTLAPTEQLAHDSDRFNLEEPDDPFVAAGVAIVSDQKIIAQRYLMLRTLHTSARGSVHLATDLEDRDLRVLKRAWRHSRSGPDGDDSRTKLQWEKKILDLLSEHPAFPRAYDIFEYEGDAFLVLEYVDGPSLADLMAGLHSRGRTLPLATILDHGKQLANALGSVHERGLVYRDLNSANVIASPERLRLIDLEMTRPAGAGDDTWIAGTPGYSSPQLFAGGPATFSDDIFSLGALLYLEATNAEPVVAPGPLLARPVRLLNPRVPEGLEHVIARCLEQDPRDRWSSMEELTAALTAIEVQPTPRPARVALSPAENDRPLRAEQARRLGDSIVATAVDRNGTPAWVTNGPLGPSAEYTDIAVGTAGVVLALAEIVDTFHEPSHRDVLRTAATALRRTEPLPIPGLYAGDAGVAVALLRAGQALADASLIEAAGQRAADMSRQPHTLSEMFLGTAGRVRAHLLLWDETGAEEQLRHAVSGGEELLSRSRDVPGRGSLWPEGTDGAPVAFLGYAHGAAGIGDALLDLFDATEDGRFLSAAERVSRVLLSNAIQVLEDGSGLDWPRSIGEPPAGPQWCHGAAGVGAFLANFHRYDESGASLEAARAAAATVATIGKTLGPTQCHGLAGSIEFLIDMFQVTGDEGFVEEAARTAHVLDAFALESDGNLMWRGDSRREVDPGYLTGYGGIAVALLRLAHPERPRDLRRRQLSSFS